VGVNRFPFSEKNVNPNDAEVAAEEHGGEEGGNGRGDDVFDGVGEFGSDADGLLEQVVFLVHVFVDEGKVKESMGPVKHEVIYDKTSRNLPRKSSPMGDGRVGFTSKIVENGGNEVDEHRVDDVVLD